MLLGTLGMPCTTSLLYVDFSVFLKGKTRLKEASRYEVPLPLVRIWI